MAKSKVNSRKATACLIFFSRTMALKRSAKTRCSLGVFRTVSSVLRCANKTCCRLKSRPRVLQCTTAVTRCH